MTRSEFIQDIFVQLYPLFADELIDYDETLGKNNRKLSEVYLEAFDMAAKAAAEAADILESTASVDCDFWKKSDD